MNTNNKTITINTDLLASLRAQKTQCNALVLALQDFIDAPGKDTDKAKRKASAARIGKDVLKRKNALHAKTPSELRQYIEGIKQKSEAIMSQLPVATWLLEHCKRELIRVTLTQIIDLCALFIQEYEEARSDSERKALADKKLANEKASLDANSSKLVLAPIGNK